MFKQAANPLYGRRVLLKFSPHYGQQECRFYIDLITQSPIFAKRWLPEFFGYISGEIENSQPRLILEDLTMQYRDGKPAVMDLKIGRILYDPLTADDSKRDKMKNLAADTTSLSLGIRVCGYRFRCEQCGQELIVDKQPGKAAKDLHDLIFLFRMFLAKVHCEIAPVAEQLVRQFSVATRRLLGDLKDSSVILRLYSSSLLLLYGRDKITGGLRCDIKLIDFAHSYCGAEFVRKLPDDGILFALRNLLDVFNSLLID